MSKMLFSVKRKSQEEMDDFGIMKL